MTNLKAVSHPVRIYLRNARREGFGTDSGDAFVGMKSKGSQLIIWIRKSNVTVEAEIKVNIPAEAEHCKRAVFYKIP